MGNLTPGATYIYERADGIVYAREFGADPKDRFVVGYESSSEFDTVRDSIKENQLWRNIHLAAKTNPALRDALDRVKILYELGKNE